MKVQIKLTPEGMFALALLEAGLIGDIIDSRVDDAWEHFTDKLSEYNYGIAEITNDKQGEKED